MRYRVERRSPDARATVNESDTWAEAVESARRVDAAIVSSDPVVVVDVPTGAVVYDTHDARNPVEVGIDRVAWIAKGDQYFAQAEAGDGREWVMANAMLAAAAYARAAL